ncbi:pyrroloquinoline quinone biosynthesis peptide chaperone PqqD [Marinobacter sp. F4216]|uniref:pyrroloquinoline quinone biosynthesis peptide chaperone PqqD n=1 Tax=Marinobacter sp. F4216 TaxID=2874281 RepID=UPI0021D9135B|nr:pyrroloquinoline quinone biosynthesis peptide chaperone PqqD [Marinobacter sp. F4216]MBZ2169839.1 pyrroloquinoline quinone biosynthesis peptide chaperone PqqD [Marinobacter sp. F4216]
MIKPHLVPRFRVGFRFQWEPAQNAYVLLYPEGMVRLNGSAGAILSEVDGERSVAEMVQRLEERYPDAGPLSDDVMGFLGEARENGWIDLI